jgi:hypothetical protein
MAEYPISFNTNMMRALLAGKKTQTRRPVSSREYEKGDVLWVREEWATLHNYDTTTTSLYRADYEKSAGMDWGRCDFMPRELSRAELIVTDTRRQRLQDITEADAIAEGICPVVCERGTFFEMPGVGQAITAQMCFEICIWREIYGGDDWARNPEVDAITFERVK